jgi:hypothetical protein
VTATYPRMFPDNEDFGRRPATAVVSATNVRKKNQL